MPLQERKYLAVSSPLERSSSHLHDHAYDLHHLSTGWTACNPMSVPRTCSTSLNTCCTLLSQYPTIGLQSQIGECKQWNRRVNELVISGYGPLFKLLHPTASRTWQLWLFEVTWAEMTLKAGAGLKTKIGMVFRTIPVKNLNMTANNNQQQQQQQARAFIYTEISERRTSSIYSGIRCSSERGFGATRLRHLIVKSAAPVKW